MSKRKNPENRINQTLTEAEFLARLKTMDAEENHWAIKILKYPVKFEELKKSLRVLRINTVECGLKSIWARLLKTLQH